MCGKYHLEASSDYASEGSWQARHVPGGGALLHKHY